MSIISIYAVKMGWVAKQWMALAGGPDADRAGAAGAALFNVWSASSIICDSLCAFSVLAINTCFNFWVYVVLLLLYDITFA